MFFRSCLCLSICMEIIDVGWNLKQMMTDDWCLADPDPQILQQIYVACVMGGVMTPENM